MTTIVFCLEGPSEEEMLKGVLPRLLPDGITPRYIVFQGKQDLHKQLVRKLRFWQEPNSLFVVLRDQDAGICRDIKKELKALCQVAGRGEALVRIACHEVESFYLGDLAAVEAALEISGLARQQAVQKYRNPDQLSNAAEELEKLTNSKYQKRAGSRAIGPFLALDGSNKSVSFNALISGIQNMVQHQLVTTGR